MTPLVFGFFTLYTCLAAVVALAALLAHARTPLTLGRVAVAAASVAGLLVVFALLGRTGPVRFRAFGIMQLVWLTMAMVVPLSGLAVLAQRRGGRVVQSGALRIARAALVMIPLAVYAMAIEPRRLQTEEAALDARVPLAHALRIGVLSDLQCSTIGDHERAAVARLMALAPDVIVIAGDIFQGSASHFERTFDDYVALLRSLSAPGGVWVVRGDVDSDGRSRSFFDELTDEAGVRVLIDEPVRIDVRGQALELYGYDRWGNDRRSLVDFLRAPRAPGAARIVLMHRPDPVLWYEEGMDVDLFVAGHTHGGQVVLPFFGPPFTLSDVPRAVGAGGLHRLNGAPIYVSRGVGMERGLAPRVRFLCPPEVALVTLRSPS